MLNSDNAEHHFSSENRRMDKGKGRQLDEPVEYGVAEELLEGMEPERPTYPPTNDDSAETRRVEEVKSFLLHLRCLLINTNCRL
jgi:hypothetical protein